MYLTLFVLLSGDSRITKLFEDNSDELIIVDQVGID